MAIIEHPISGIPMGMAILDVVVNDPSLYNEVCCGLVRGKRN